MNIVFDNIIFSKERQGGISNYWYELIKQYENSFTDYFFEEKRALDNIFRKKLNLRSIIPHYHLPLPLARMLPIYYGGKNDKILYHSSFYRKLITSTKVCEITTVHDFLYHKYSSGIKKLIHNQLKFAAIKRARGIICVSKNTLKDLKKYYTPTSSQQVKVIYNGVSDDYMVVNKRWEFENYLNSLNLNEKYLLFVGARSQYKNFDFVVNLMAHVAGYKLVVVGNILSEAERHKIPKHLLSRIVVANNISNLDLNILYNYAHALLYPSSFEGFGIPVIEAMKAGCPVLSLNVTSIPEVAGGAAVLFENLDIKNFVQQITLLEKEDYRLKFVEAGLENSKRFVWRKCVEETTEFYNEVYNNNS